MSRHMPSVIGCAVGFCAAGSFFGSIIGVFMGDLIWTATSKPDPALDAFQANVLRMRFLYLWMYSGIFAGMALGAIAGVRYARTVRRSRSGLDPRSWE